MLCTKKTQEKYAFTLIVVRSGNSSHLHRIRLVMASNTRWRAMLYWTRHTLVDMPCEDLDILGSMVVVWCEYGLQGHIIGPLGPSFVLDWFSTLENQPSPSYYFDEVEHHKQRQKKKISVLFALSAGLSSFFFFPSPVSVTAAAVM